MNQDKPVCLIMTDSVALPRKYSGGMVNWKETYPNRLKRILVDFEVITLSIGGASITDLRNQVNYYKILNPKIVILQCGIVDAAPRAFGRIEMEIIKKLRIFRITKPFVSFLRKYRAHNYTSPSLFEKSLLEIKKALNTENFFTIGILPACKEFEQILPGITKNIFIYNNILKRSSDMISVSEIPKEGIAHDYHHLNIIGHEHLYDLIVVTLKTKVL